MTTHAARAVTPHVTPAVATQVLRHRVPKRPSLPLMARRERVLLEESGGIVVTNFELCVRDGTGWFRLPWEEIGRVRMDGGELELTRFFGGTLRVRPAAGSRLPAVVRERVAATELAGVRLTVHGYLPAVVTARRRPTTGEVIWIALLPDGIDPDEPEVVEQVDEAIHNLRRQLGLA